MTIKQFLHSDLMKDEEEEPMAFLGDPHYQCYRLDGHDYDSFGYCRSCKNPSQEAFLRAKGLTTGATIRNEFRRLIRERINNARN